MGGALPQKRRLRAGENGKWRHKEVGTVAASLMLRITRKVAFWSNPPRV